MVVEHRTFRFNYLVEFFAHCLFRKSFNGTHFHEHHLITDDHLDCDDLVLSTGHSIIDT